MMLSRAADSLFWLARYVERADDTARIIDATSRLAATPITYVGEANEWESALAAAGALGAYKALHETTDRDTVIDFLAFSTDNPSSIKSCIAVARHNARAERTALTMEMWEAINSAWLDLKRFDGTHMDRDTLNEFPDQREGSLPALRRRRLSRPCCATTPISSCASASISNAPIPPPASST